MAFEKQENQCSDQWPNRGLMAVYSLSFKSSRGLWSACGEWALSVCAGLSVITVVLYQLHCNHTFFLLLSQVKQSCFSLRSFAYAEFNRDYLCCSPLMLIHNITSLMKLTVDTLEHVSPPHVLASFGPLPYLLSCILYWPCLLSVVWSVFNLCKDRCVNATLLSITRKWNGTLLTIIKRKEGKNGTKV